MSVGEVAVLLVLRAREKRAARGSADRLVILDRQLRRGEIPSSPADREAMRGLVEQRLHRTRRRKPALVMLCLMYALLVTVLLLLDSGREALVHLPATAAALAVVVAVAGSAWLRREVAANAPAGDETPAGDKAPSAPERVALGQEA